MVTETGSDHRYPSWLVSKTTLCWAARRRPRWCRRTARSTGRRSRASTPAAASPRCWARASMGAGRSRPPRGEELATVGDFTIAPGERRAMIMTWFASHEPLPQAIDPATALRETESWWREWSGRCSYDGPWREAVLTSLMVLKALTFGPT